MKLDPEVETLIAVEEMREAWADYKADIFARWPYLKPIPIAKYIYSLRKSDPYRIWFEAMDERWGDDA